MIGNIMRARRSVLLACAAGLLASCMADTTKVKQTSTSVTAGISSAENADAIMELPVLFYVANEGVESVELLKWNTPLEKVLSADIFKVTRDGTAVDYVGRTMKRSSPEADDFMVLDAGARQETLIDIARYYDTSAAGSYEVTFQPLGADEGYVNNGVAVSLDPTVVTVTRQ